jgi:hypothetical protein
MVDKKYLAGFVDGEGCFNIFKNRTTLSPRLLIVNSNLRILEEIKEKYGGDISSRRNGPSNWKTFNMYRASNKAFRLILKDILPYLKLKKKQAILCGEMLKNKGINRRLEIKNEMHLLNKRGI